MRNQFIRLIYKILLTAVTLLSPYAAQAQALQRDVPMSSDWKIYHLTKEARTQADADNEFMAVLTLTPDEGWYTYSNSPGTLGKPTMVKAQLIPGRQPLDVYYPPGQLKKDLSAPTVTVSVYSEATPIFVPIPNWTDTPFSIKAELNLLLCSRTRCLPLETEFIFLGSRINKDQSPLAHEQEWWPLFLAARSTPSNAKDTVQEPSDVQNIANPYSLISPTYFQPALEVSNIASAVLFALLAGFILNFMPCVLPVVSLKITALLSGNSDQDETIRKKTFRSHNLFFALGIILYFICLSLILGAGELAWGEMFQRTDVVLILTAVIFALSLSLFGVYHLPVVDLKFGQGIHRPRLQALSTGILATLLATPCSGPFLGGVLAWTLTKPPHLIVAVFISIGIGMASPYLIMAARPSLVRFLPKPGAWTAHVEKAVAIFLMGSCLYLINILPDDFVVPCLILLWLTALATWIWGLTTNIERFQKKATLRILILAVLAFAAYWAILPRPGSAWNEFDSDSFSKRLGTENIVVDFTANWCPTCKFLEKSVLTPANLKKWSQKYKLAFIQADLTENNPAAEKLLKALGGKSIPVLAIFSRGNPYKPLVIRDLFNTAQLEQALDQVLEKN